MKKLAFLGGAAGLGLIALLHSPITQAADHADASTAAANPMADLNDVYTWMTPDGLNINLALTVSPFDNGSREFGTSVQYVFHVDRYAAFPASAALIAAGQESKVICTFKSNTDGQCWVINPAGQAVAYVKGDFSGTTGKANADGTLKVFAGRRSDPFFFNLAGYVAARTKFEQACTGTAVPGTCPGVIAPTLDAAGCPKLPGSSVAPIAVQLGTTQATVLPGVPCPPAQVDCFLNANVMALVVQVDKTLIATDDKKLLGVWASTHAGQ